MKTQEIDGLACYLVELFVARSPLSGNMGSLILESDPTPDYYAKGNFPPNKEHVNDRHLYLPVKKNVNCFQDVVYRKACQLTERMESILSIYPGQMTFQNKEHQCIRINICSDIHMSELIEEFNNLGISFYSDKHVLTYSSLIYYKKYTSFNFMEEGVYNDTNNKNRYFFEIPKHIEHDELKNGITQIKNNCDYHLFDSFIVTLFYKNGVRDFIGIYSLHCDETRFGELKKQISSIFK
jgi:hypothetical protein